MTLANVYRTVFSKGWRKAWTGGVPVALSAAPKYLTLGPVYYFCNDSLGLPTFATVCVVTVGATFAIYGGETQNIQLALNDKRPGSIPSKVASYPWWKRLSPASPGWGINLVRNYITISGMRPLAEYTTHKIESMPGASNLNSSVTYFCGAGIANIAMAMLSMPSHQLYGFWVSNPHLWELKDTRTRAKAAMDYFRGQYFKERKAKLSTGVNFIDKYQLSKVLVRDLGLRTLYSGALFTLYGFTERMIVNQVSNKG